MEIIKPKEEVTLTLKLDEDDLKYLRGITQNYIGENPSDENQNDKRVRLALFVASSRALGVNMLDDGSITREIN